MAKYNVPVQSLIDHIKTATDVDPWTQEMAEELLTKQETADTGKARIFQCEKCGYGVEDIYLTNEHDFDIFPHFCPNCGRVVKQEAKSTPTAGTNEIPLKW